ncbi:hypothetical protein HPB49_018494 [Dermacentor silvarum]|uniref:Uncharacterized protein n=1 Tax=Dermacentor silvarum TaxID=543639 RepID=A0ACB8D7D5_DERSI|nr:hypothetical protein HPB49_018494 [Dermacentor silvarum]
MAAVWKCRDRNSSFLDKLSLHGDKYCSSIHTRMLIAAYDDYLVAWSQHQQRLFAVSAKTFSSTVEPDDCLELLLSNPPIFDVDNVCVNCTKHLLLSGPRGLTVVALPKTPATLVKEKKASCRSWTLGEHFFLCHKSISLVDIAWHPDSESGLHVLALTSDNNLRLYDISEPQSAQLVLPVGVNHGITGTISASVGDAAVSFDFGDLSAEGKARQVFVLMGSGDIYLTHVSPQDDNRYQHKHHLSCKLFPAAVQKSLSFVIIDSTNHQRYICVHNAGVHAVAVPFIDHLQAFAEDDTAMQMVSELHTETSIVESLLCTRALASSKPAPPVGVAVVPGHPGPLLIVLTAAWKLITITLMQGYQSYLPALLSQSQQDTPLMSKQGATSSLVAHVQQLLDGRSLPTLAQAAEDCTPQQSLELLLTATQRIREQWIQKLEACQLLIARRVQAAQDQRDLQLEKLSALLEELGVLQQRDRALRTRYEALYSTQQKLVKRVEDVLHQLQRQVPVLSAAEQAMTEELKTIQEKLKVFKELLEQAQAKQKYQEQSNKDQEANRIAGRYQPRNLTANQVQQIRKALKQEGDIIAELVQRLSGLMD